uniref:Uncharacterized protein n=1 Tax=Fundulus heteroclitus TaxID=8078 RepID=A0A3Q2QKC7_FUNHE
MGLNPDVSEEAIKRTFFNRSGASQAQTVVPGLAAPDGLACDWLGKKLYWTDSDTNRIEVAELDGSLRKVLFWQELDQPRAIALDPERGTLSYIIHWNANSRLLERVALKPPANLPGRSHLSWACLQVMNMNGSGRRVLVEDKLPHIFGFSLLGDFIYWTDWQRRSIERVHKRTAEREFIIDQLPDLMGLKATQVHRASGESGGTGWAWFCGASPTGPGPSW